LQENAHLEVPDARSATGDVSRHQGLILIVGAALQPREDGRGAGPVAGEVDVGEIAHLDVLAYLLWGADDILICRIMVAIRKELREISAAWESRKQLLDVLRVDFGCADKVLLDCEDVVDAAE
jgi:hypothetical protein